MTDPFVNRLLQFARAVDSLGSETMEQVERQFFDYMRETLQVCFYEVLLDGKTARDEQGKTQPHLQTVWCWDKERRREHLMRISWQDGAPANQRAHAYLENQSVWVTAPEGGPPLREAPDAAEILPEGITLPAYTDYSHDDDGVARTALAKPLRYEGRVIGVFSVELPVRVEMTQSHKAYFDALSEALGTLHGRHRTTLRSGDQTRQAFTDLMAEVVRSTRNPLSGNPSLFLSYSDRRDTEVLELVLEALEPFHEHIDVVDWKTLTDPGSITDKVVEEIGRASFGICITSEVAENGGAPRDNPNVLFEAGMMHVQEGRLDGAPMRWLPIREDKTLAGDPPFNFANLRICTVPRDPDGVLDRDAFFDSVQDHLTRLLGYEV